MSELDTEDLVEDRWRTLLSGIIKKQLLEMFDNVYKKQWKDIIEKKLTAISETETFVISKTQMTPKKQLTMKLLRSKWYIEQEVPKYQI